MRNGWLFLVLLPGMLLIRLPADSTPIAEQGYETGRVVSIKRYEAVSNHLGENPVDAPLRAREYAYDIEIQLACNIYVGRYESATNYVPAVLAVNQPVDVRMYRHVIYIGQPGEDWDIELGIVSHKHVKNAVCTSTS